MPGFFFFNNNKCFICIIALVLQSVWLIKEVGKVKGKLFTKFFIFYIRFNDSEIMLISVQKLITYMNET